jgi:hypothetical protein
MPSPNPSSTQGNVLSGTTAISANDVWAVGAWTYSAPYDQTLAEHWDGTAWTTVPTPNPSPGLNALFAVAAVSSSDVWAVGSTAARNTGDTTIAEHWNGSTWSAVPTPNATGAGSDLFAVTAIASNNVWAVGQFIALSTNNTLVEHWDGSSWTIVPSPNAGTSNNQLFGVSAFGAGDVWAVGYYRPSAGAARQSLAEHWNGTSWTVVPSFSQAGNTQMNAVTALAPGTAVGVGYARISSGAPALPFQFGLSSGGGVGGNFSVAVPMPGTGDNAFRGVTVGASGKVWAVGWWSQLTSSPAQTFVASASYTSGFLGMLIGGSSENRSVGGLNNLLLAVTAVSPNGFWATGWSDGMFAPQTLTELNCRPHFTLTAPASTAASTSFGLTVTAADLGGTTVTGYLGTVHFTSSDPQAVLPADYTFVPGDSGAHDFAGVILNSVGTQTITAADTSVGDIHGSSVIRVTCLGACQAPAGTAGSRNTKAAPPGSPGTRSGANPSGAGSPGPRVPRLGLSSQSADSAPSTARATTTGQATNVVAAAPAAASTSAQSATSAGGAVGAGPSNSSVQAPAQEVVSLVARKAAVRRPDPAPWNVLLLLPLIACALAVIAVAGGARTHATIEMRAGTLIGQPTSVVDISVSGLENRPHHVLRSRRRKMPALGEGGSNMADQHPDGRWPASGRTREHLPCES